jgi:hypothetical protein
MLKILVRNTLVITWNMMNILFLTTRIVLVMVIFSQLSFGMKRSHELVPKFTCFSELHPEMQQTIFRHSDNKSNFQKINQDWYKKGSIKSPTVFVDDFYGMSPQQLTRILLNAVYEQNEEGVKNILKNSNILKYTQNNQIYYHLDNYIHHHLAGTSVKVVLDVCWIAKSHNNNVMQQLLESYKIVCNPTTQIQCTPTKLLMACLAGNSDSIEWHLNDLDNESRNIEYALKIVIDCDHGKCAKVLLNSLYGKIYEESSFIDIIEHLKPKKSLFTKELLERTCYKKSIYALKELLAFNYFDVNEVSFILNFINNPNLTSFTLLDKILKKEKKDFEYNAVALLLKQYGAKTAAELAIDVQDEEDIVNKINVMGCIIS